MEAAHGVPPGSTQVIVMLESARAVLFAYALATASPRVASLVFGGARDADLNNDIGCAWSIDGPEILHARQQALLAARAAGIACPLDGVFADVRDAQGFERDTTLSRRLGFRGRAVIHPAQVEAANRLYAPTSAEVDYYARVLKALDEAHARGQAATTVDGRMVDEAMGLTARRVLAQADLHTTPFGRAS
jgi:citrate lyase subunit beta/citryl-CoA lyase